MTWSNLSIPIFPIAFSIIAFLPFPLAGQFEVNNRQILLEGSPFHVRGICYQPTPIGDDPSARPPYGDYYTLNYQELYERDLPVMREMGCNLIRIYGWNPHADHADFLSQCYNGGDRPIFVLLIRWIDPETDWEDAQSINDIQEDFLAMAKEARKFPAVFAIALGNDANIYAGNGLKPAFWQAHNQIAGAIKSAHPNLLVSMAITDSLPAVAAFDAAMDQLDFWSIQVYRGTSFGTFFDDYAASSQNPC